MSAISECAQNLCDKLSSIGNAAVTYPRSLFGGEASSRPNLAGSINDRPYKAILYDDAPQQGIPVFSAHFSSDITGIGLSPGQIAHWNADNRFSKIYRQDEDHTFLVMDTLLSFSDDGLFATGVANIWAMAMKEISGFKRSCERLAIS